MNKDIPSSNTMLRLEHIVDLLASRKAAKGGDNHTGPDNYRNDNVAAAIAIMTDQPTGDVVVDNYQPRTVLGRKLIALRRAHVLAGGRLLGWDEIDEEVRLRRGGIADA